MIVRNMKSDVDIGSPGPEEESVEDNVKKRKGKKRENQRNEKRGL